MSEFPTSFDALECPFPMTVKKLCYYMPHFHLGVLSSQKTFTEILICVGVAFGGCAMKCG